MSRVTRALPALLACLVLAACSTGSTGSAGRSTGGGAGAGGGGAHATGRNAVEPGGVDVDTASLRSMKALAKVATCVPGTSQGDLPHVTLPCLGGGPAVDLTRLRGPLVINLFAPWCGPCRNEMPIYERLHREAGGRLTVLGIDYLDVQPAAALALVRKTGVTYPLLADPAGLLRTDFRIRGLPGIVMVDRRGRVVDVEFREVSSWGELRGLVRQHLGVRLPA